MECGVITDAFLSSLRELKDFAPQFHLSLQSGSDRVLKAMNRRYTRAVYMEKCRKAYEYFPDAAITTDIIAGYATETEEDFLQSLSVIEEVGFARVHAFAYSPREGTAAFRLKDIPAEIKSERLHRLLKAAERTSTAFASRFIGKSQSIIAEEFVDGYTSGYTGNYIRVYVPDKLQAGKKYNVKIKNLYKDGVIAETDG